MTSGSDAPDTQRLVLQLVLGLSRRPYSDPEGLAPADRMALLGFRFQRALP